MDNKRRVEIKCFHCGTVELSDEEYMRQLSLPDYKWQCPKCKRTAMFGGIYHRCLADNCDGWASEDTDQCEKCGAYQEELWDAQIPDAE